MSQETHYVTEDGSTAHPCDVAPDKDGILRAKDGRAVKMRSPGVPHTRGVDPDEQKPLPKAKEVKPEKPKPVYKTRESKTD